MLIELGMPSLSETDREYLEHELVKGRVRPTAYQTAGWAWDPSPVLLFEPKPIQSLLYESCMDGPGRYLSTLCVSTRFCENIRDLKQGEVISNQNS